MSAKILDGKALAASRQREELRDLRKKIHRKPCLAIITASDDPASDIYIRNKQRACGENRIDCLVIKKNYTYEEIRNGDAQHDLKRAIGKLNEAESVTAIMVQLPLPNGLNEQEIVNYISPSKDVDGLTDINMAHLIRCFPYKIIMPCTPKGIIQLFYSANIDFSKKEAVIVGRSDIVGKPIAMMLMHYDCTVTICHSYTANLAQHTRNADILIVAAGHPGLITKDMVKPGAVVVDVGINRVDGKIVGDVAPDVAEVAGYITPVPGGVGPMTVSCLEENVLDIAREKERWG